MKNIFEVKRFPVLICLFVLFIPSIAVPNGIRENYSWQFASTTERAHKAAVLDLILKENAGMYKPLSTTNNLTSYAIQEIAGDYIDCNMTSQSLGNTSDSSVSDLDDTGNEASVVLNSSHTLSDSSVTSTISGSNACDFNVVSEGVEAPINSEGGN